MVSLVLPTAWIVLLVLVLLIHSCISSNSSDTLTQTRLSMKNNKYNSEQKRKALVRKQQVAQQLRFYQHHHRACHAPPNADVAVMMSLIDEYIKLHSWETLRRESPSQLCRRRFLNSVWRSRCNPLGNGFQPPLNALVEAVILNRTIVLTPVRSCAKQIHWAPWLVMLGPLEQLLRGAGCPTDLRTRFDIDQVPRLNPPSRCELMQGLRDPPVVTLAAGHDTNFSHYDAHIVGTSNAGWSGEDYFNNAYDLFRPNDVRNGMQGAYLLRAKQVFGSGDQGDPRFRFHGAMAYRALVVSDKVTTRIKALIGPRSCAEDVVIAVHARHFSLESEEASRSFDMAFVTATAAVVSELVGNLSRTCRVLLASDRPHMLRLFQSSALPCDMIVNGFLKSSPPNVSFPTEHGPFAQSIRVLEDVQLLSHADYFIGTATSSLSMFILNLVTFNALSRNITCITSTFITDRGEFQLFQGYKSKWHGLFWDKLRLNTKQVLDCRKAKSTRYMQLSPYSNPYEGNMNDRVVNELNKETRKQRTSRKRQVE